MRQRGPISAPSPITASGPISALGSTAASGATTADGCTPGRDRRQRMEQRRDPRPGDIGLGRRRWRPRSAARAPPCRDARSPRRPASSASAVAYLRLSRKLTSPGSAVCSGATPVSIRRRGGASRLAPHRPPPRGYAGRSGGRSAGPRPIGGQSICRASAPASAASVAAWPAAWRRGGFAGCAACGRRRCGAARRRWRRRSACIATGETPSGGITTDASTLFDVVHHRGGQVEIVGRAEDLRAVQHQVDAAADRHLLRHQLDGAVDLRHHVLAGLLDDPIALAEHAARFGDAVLQFLLAVADLLRLTACRARWPSACPGRAAPPAPSAHPRSASGRRATNSLSAC